MYIRNLPESVKPARLRKLLNATLSEYGQILDIFVCRQKRVRGQAFVCFDELSSAIKAKDGLQGFEFLNRPLHIGYSKSKSHALMKKDGTYAAMMFKIRDDWLKDKAAAAARKARDDIADDRADAERALQAVDRDAEAFSKRLLQGGYSGISDKPTTLILLRATSDRIVEQVGQGLLGSGPGLWQGRL